MDKNALCNGKLDAAPSKSVVLIGYQDQGNLGLGYLSAVLLKKGYEVYTLDINQTPGAILACIREHKPMLVGFSLIFQHFLPNFINLMTLFRIRGVSCHFTIGGHYPSLCYEQTLKQMPELDSVVMFEGEETITELADRLFKNEDWRSCKGIAYRKDGQVVLNPLRPLIEDLDQLPFPHRPFPSNDTLGKKKQPILATRGCMRRCAFCSIREFYTRAPGKIVRRRSPANVVQEMKQLHFQDDVSIFLFQDDDFPLVGNSGRAWVLDFIKELKAQDLAGRLIWKISCRVDEVDRKLFLKMKEAGLYLVYLGIESGTDAGLKTLNKQVTVDDNKRAVAVLKELDILFGYGFMLFDPDSDFDSILSNIHFLRHIIGDGASAAVYCKMRPYAGTPIEKTLKAAGRLRGSVSQPDYNFLDPKMDEYFNKLGNALAPWVQGPEAISHNLNLLRHEVEVIKRLFPKLSGTGEYERFLKRQTQKSNETIFRAIENSALMFQRENCFSLDSKSLKSDADMLKELLMEKRDQFVFQNQNRMLEALV